MELLPTQLRIAREELQLSNIPVPGVVLKGKWKGENVSVKVIQASTLSVMEEMCKELVSLATLRSLFTCKIHGGCIPEERVLWIVQEYVEGENFADFLATKSDWSFREQLYFMIQAVRAIHFLHSLPVPIFHRNIKTSNFIVKNKTKLVMTEYGLAAVNSSNGSGMSKWSPPEFGSSVKKWSQKGDVYGLGMVLFEILTCQLPLCDELDFTIILQKMKNGAVQGIPQGPAGILTRMIALCRKKSPSKRPTTSQILCDLAGGYIVELFRVALFGDRQNREAMISLISVGSILNPSEIVPKTYIEQWAEKHFNEVVRSGRRELVREFLRLGFDVNGVDKAGTAPIHIAAWRGDVEIFRELLVGGVDINIVDKEGRTSLHMAIEAGHLGFVGELLKSGVDKEGKGKIDETPLLVAAHTGHLEILVELVKAGANVNGKNGKNGDTALLVSASKGHLAVVNELVKLGAQLELTGDDGKTALHKAAQYGHCEIVRALLKLGVNIEATGNDGFTPLHSAAFEGVVETITELLSSGANLQAVAQQSRQATPLHLAVANAKFEAIRALIKSGADVEAKAEADMTPLHLAAFLGQPDIVVELIQLGANKEAKDENGMTPIHLACSHGLKESGKKQNVAESKRYLRTVKELAERGADVEVKDSSKITPAAMASMFGYDDIVEELIMQGATVNRRELVPKNPFKIRKCLTLAL